jgi:hypothetical protein
MTKRLAPAAALSLALAVVSAGGQEVRFASSEEIAAQARAGDRAVLFIRIALGLWIAASVAIGFSTLQSRQKRWASEHDAVRSAVLRELGIPPSSAADAQARARILALAPATVEEGGLPTPRWLCLVEDRLIAIDIVGRGGRSFLRSAIQRVDVLESAAALAVAVVVEKTDAGRAPRFEIARVEDGLNLLAGFRRAGIQVRYRGQRG